MPLKLITLVKIREHNHSVQYTRIYLHNISSHQDCRSVFLKQLYSNAYRVHTQNSIEHVDIVNNDLCYSNNQ